MADPFIRVLFTLDYEIHGNGEGCPHELMVEPTQRLLGLFDRYGAKLTIMADIGEILKFKQHAEQSGKDDYHYGSIVRQLQSAIRGGHDVQLHIHSSYFNAVQDCGRWLQDWSEYNFAGLKPERLQQMVQTGKEFLESTLQPINPAYRCTAFRAANWSVSPSRHVVEALAKNGIHIDTSVFKYGRRTGLVNFDYTAAHSEMLPWRADPDAIWQRNPNGPIWEVPIYSENRLLPAFLSVNRMYRFLSGRLHSVPKELSGPSANGNSEYHSPSSRRRLRSLGGLLGKHAWKADFNQCTGRQLIRALNRAERRHQRVQPNVPFVLIGHSKLFTQWNERTLRPFLTHVAAHPSLFGFGTFDSLSLAS